MRSLVIGDVTVTGEPAVAFVSDGDVVVEGHVVVRAGWGPHVADCAGTTSQCNEGTDCGGSGGGGFGTPGGRGGDSAGNTGGDGGVAVGNPELEPLRGGCHGGAGYEWMIGPAIKIVSGGNAGGAVQLVSRTRIALTEGKLDANGWYVSSGIGSDPSFVDGALAGGGGSGGGILLEAPVIEAGFGTVIAANGSGGGGGGGTEGEDGQLSDGAAGGGPCASLGDGGRGATGTITAQNGAPNATAAGGGGGGAGRIRFNTDAGGLVLDEGAIVSPPPSLGALGTR